ETIRLQRVMESRDDLLLQGWLEIDEHIAAGDQVDAREGRILHEIVLSKNNEVANGFVNPVTALFLREIFLQPRAADHADVRFAVNARAGGFKHGAIHVTRKNLDRHAVLGFLREFRVCHRQRVSLLPGGTAGHPNAQAVRARKVFYELREDLSLERLEHRGIPEEAR